MSRVILRYILMDREDKESQMERLGELLEKSLKRLNLAGRLTEYSAWPIWNETVGPTIARNAQLEKSLACRSGPKSVTCKEPAPNPCSRVDGQGVSAADFMSHSPTEKPLAGLILSAERATYQVMFSNRPVKGGSPGRDGRGNHVLILQPSSTRPR